MRKQVSILVVDDDLEMLKTLSYILTYKGYEVVTLSSGAEAIEMVKKRSFDIVLSDIKMPGINGVEVLKEIKRLSPETAIMMITAYTMHGLVEEAKKEGARSIFSKPLDLDKIISCAEEVKGSKHMPVQNDDSELNGLFQILEDKERAIREKDLLIEEIRKELAGIRENPSRVLDDQRKKRQSENIHSVLKPKQFELFKVLCQGEKNYDEILQTAHSKNIDIRDMAALRLQISRLDKKLNQETNYKIVKIRRDKVLFFGIDGTPSKEIWLKKGTP